MKKMRKRKQFNNYDLNSTPDPCEDCLTKDLTSSCITDCSAPIEGTLGSNLINVIDDVSDKETCDKLCQDEEICSVYTYHPANNPTFPETCYLLTEIQEPVRECMGDTCETGLPDCEGNVCAFIVDGAMFPQVVHERNTTQIRIMNHLFLTFFLERDSKISIFF